MNIKATLMVSCWVLWFGFGGDVAVFLITRLSSKDLEALALLLHHVLGSRKVKSVSILVFLVCLSTGSTRGSSIEQYNEFRFVLQPQSSSAYDVSPLVLSLVHSDFNLLKCFVLWSLF
ncbi:hypothetical protein Bca4012_068079 [Brassica carinata]